MPELPECETIVRTIRPAVWGCSVLDLVVAPGATPEVSLDQIKGQVIRTVERQAKYIVFKLDTGYLVSHMRMTGQWFFAPPNVTIPGDNKYFRWGLSLAGPDGKFCGHLWFQDVRKFGTLVWTEDLHNYKPIAKLGPDGLSLRQPKKVYSVISAAKKSKRPIKNMLLDQKVVGGNGNIYSSECLFAAMVDPRSPARDLDSESIIDICENLYNIFQDAIDLGGTTLSDHQGGMYQHVLQVYGREKEPCFVCSTPIVKITQAGRSTYFCPKCQGGEE